MNWTNRSKRIIEGGGSVMSGRKEITKKLSALREKPLPEMLLMMYRSAQRDRYKTNYWKGGDMGEQGDGTTLAIGLLSEFLKKVGTIERAEIWIKFKANKKDTDPGIEHLTENTPEERADQIIERASGYMVQEINVNKNAVIISAVKIERRPPDPEKEQDERREEQKQAIQGMINRK